MQKVNILYQGLIFPGFEFRFAKEYFGFVKLYFQSVARLFIGFLFQIGLTTHSTFLPQLSELIENTPSFYSLNLQF